MEDGPAVVQKGTVKAIVDGRTCVWRSVSCKCGLKEGLWNASLRAWLPWDGSPRCYGQVWDSSPPSFWAVIDVRRWWGWPNDDGKSCSSGAQTDEALIWLDKIAQISRSMKQTHNDIRCPLSGRSLWKFKKYQDTRSINFFRKGEKSLTHSLCSTTPPGGRSYVCQGTSFPLLVYK